MSCYHPWTAFQQSDGSVVLREVGDVVRSLTLPCGNCVGCLLERSRQWAVRCVHESKMHEFNSFVRLSYRDEDLPRHNSLHYPHFQKFMRDVRYWYGDRVPFFMSGEYGENYGRPHYHALLFGVNFHDMYYWCKSPSGKSLYRSDSLEWLWPYGDSTIGAVTFESAAYCARYVMKKRKVVDVGESEYQIVDVTTGEILTRVAEFCHMSLKPGIGALWLDKFWSDVFPAGKVVTNGVEGNTPRYYEKIFKEREAESFEALVAERDRVSKLHAADNTPERLAVKEVVKLADVRRLTQGRL